MTLSRIYFLIIAEKEEKNVTDVLLTCSRKKNDKAE